MKVVVLGAGVVGVTSAWYLAEAGHEVTVVDRQPFSGFETSFANGGQISVSHAEPWANPGAPRQILHWLGREDAPLLFRPRASLRQWSWGIKFLFECLPARTRRNTLQILRLALYSRNELQALRARTGIEYDHGERGILHLYTDPRELEAALARMEVLRAHGFDLQVLTPAQCVALEPALAYSQVRFAGGTYAPADESGDAHLFSRRIEELCREAGVQLLFQSTILRVLSEGNSISGVHIRHVEGAHETVQGDAYLACLGSFTPLLLQPLGVHVPVFPVKGYSITVPVEYEHGAPQVCLTDEGGKLAISRLGERLRVAGTAELDGYDTAINAVRCMAILSRAEALLPKGGDYSRAQCWAGLRPATPGNVPVIGRTHLTNLYLNTGHGTLGWTLACGSAHAIADLISGRKPEVDFDFREG